MKNLVPCLLIVLLFVLGCGTFTKNFKRSSGNYDPYTGSLSELLPSEISSLRVTFKSQGTRDTTADYKGAAKEAKAFTYMQEAAGIGVQVDGALVNFNSAATAKEQLQKVADEVKGTITNKDKGLRFTAENGKIVGWTNGSLMCLVKSSAGTKPAENFEEAVPF